MQRRSFLKNSIGALLLGALSSNKVLASTINALTPESLNVLLYLIQNKNGDWKIKGTKWTDIKTARLSQFEYDLNTFKPLTIVDNIIVNDVKEKYWKEYNCKGKCPKNVNYLSSYKSGLKAKQSGQWAEALKKSYGASHRIHPQYWKEHGSKRGKQNIESGHLSKLHKLYGKDLGKKWGKVGAKVVVDNKLGIHSASKQQRKEWASIGGKVGGKATSLKYDMKVISKLGNEANVKKYGKPLYAYNLITFESIEFDSIGGAEKYTDIQSVTITKILRGLQSKTRCGWTFLKK
jgi:hypothetical protein